MTEVGRGLLIWFLCLSALLLFYFGGQVNPVASLLASILVPLPVLLAGWRLGERGALTLALATALIIFSQNPGLAVISENLGFGELLLMGVMLSALQWRGWPAPKAIIITVVALNLLTVFFLLGQSLFLGMSLQALVAQKIGEVMETFRKLMHQMGNDNLMIPGVPASDIETVLRHLLPGLMVTNTALMAWLNVVLSRPLAFSWYKGPQEPLYRWSPPEWLIFVLLGAGFLLLVPVGLVRLFAMNLLLVLALIYFSQGVAVISAWFHRLGVPRILRLLGYPVLFLNPLFFLIITLGLMDLWLDFRRLHQPTDA